MTRRVRIYLVWGLLIVLAGIVIALESREPAPPGIPSEEQRRLFAFREAEVGQVDIFYRGRLASLLRSPGGLWFQHDGSHRHSQGGAPPENGAAAGDPGTSARTAPSSPVPAGAAVPGADAPHPEPDAARAEKLATAIDFLARLVFDRRIAPTEPLREYGLENPQIVVVFYPRNKDNSPGPAPLTSFYVGTPLSHDQSFYAQVSGDQDIALIPLYQINNLTELTLGEVAQASPGALGPDPTNR